MLAQESGPDGDAGGQSFAARTAEELHGLGLGNQRLVVNGVFHASAPGDATAKAIEALGRQALHFMPDALARLPRDDIPLRAFDTVAPVCIPCWDLIAANTDHRVADNGRISLAHEGADAAARLPRVFPGRR